MSILPLVAAVCNLAPSSIASQSLPTYSAFEAAMLESHNAARAEMRVPPVRWNPSLANDAAAHARLLAGTGAMAHAPGLGEQGENLWAGTSGAYSPQAMVALWIAEKRHYRVGVFPANSRTGRLDDVAHYTQIIWRTTQEIGCAAADNGAFTFLVCRYGEGGNMIGERPV